MTPEERAESLKRLSILIDHGHADVCGRCNIAQAIRAAVEEEREAWMKMMGDWCTDCCDGPIVIAEAIRARDK